MDTKRAITEEILAGCEQAYEGSPLLRAMTNALNKNAIETIACVPGAEKNTQFGFSIEIPTMPVTNQKKSGRCWLFAGLNLLRERVAAKCHLENFELSQNYMAFWDKFEKINYFLEAMIDLAGQPVDDRVVTYLLQTGIGDGGQWDMFAALVHKYGVVPKAAMEETFQSSNTRNMNSMIGQALAACTARMRRLHAQGAGRDALEAEKAATLRQMYSFLCTCFGQPPKTFDFEYVDRDNRHHVVPGLTPQQFMQDFVGMELDAYVSLINAPTADKPYHRTYTVDYLGNVVGGAPVRYLNVEMDVLKQAIIRQLTEGEIVWFGSDVSQFGDRETGVWDDKAFDYNGAFGIDFSLTKEEALDYRISAMNHAMAITGVNLDSAGHPTKWKIENSWSDEHGHKGYYVMSDSWFDRFTYQAVIRKDLLDETLQAELKQEPIHLHPWDPMGSLAD